LVGLRRGTADSLDAVDTHVAPEVVAPTQRTVADEHRVAGGPTWAEGTPLRAPGWQGVVTGGAGEPGDAVRSGTVLMEVSGVPRMAVASQRPFYRQLRQGDTG